MKTCKKNYKGGSMLTLKVKGDEHPKTFVLVTDDADGELDRLQEIIHAEIGAPPDDPMREWFDNHSADQFAEGVEIPQDWMAEFMDVLEEWPQAYEVFDKERREAYAQAEEALGDH